MIDNIEAHEEDFVARHGQTLLTSRTSDAHGYMGTLEDTMTYINPPTVNLDHANEREDGLAHRELTPG